MPDLPDNSEPVAASVGVNVDFNSTSLPVGDSAVLDDMQDMTAQADPDFSKTASGRKRPPDVAARMEQRYREQQERMRAASEYLPGGAPSEEVALGDVGSPEDAQYELYWRSFTTPIYGEGSRYGGEAGPPPPSAWLPVITPETPWHLQSEGERDYWRRQRGPDEYVRSSPPPLRSASSSYKISMDDIRSAGNAGMYRLLIEKGYSDEDARVAAGMPPPPPPPPSADQFYRRGDLDEYIGAQQRGFEGSLEDYAVSGSMGLYGRRATAAGVSYDADAQAALRARAFSSWDPMSGVPFEQQVAATDRGYMGEFMHGLGGWGGVAIGYPLMESFSGAARAWSPYLRGESTIPGQPQSETAAAMIPLLATLIGTGIGAAVPGGALVGSVIGGFAGSGLQELAEPMIERNFGAASTGTKLGAATGALDEFTAALRSAGGSIKDVGDAMEAGRFQAPYGPEGSRYLGRLSAGEGVAFGDIQGQARQYLGGSPFLARYFARYQGDSAVGGEVTSAEWGQVAGAAAASGDFGGMESALSQETTLRNQDARDTAVRAFIAAGFHGSDVPQPGDIVNYEQGGKGSVLGAQAGNASLDPVLNAYRRTVLANNAQARTESAADSAAWLTIQGAQASEQSGAAIVGASQAALQRRLALGEGMGAYSATMPGLTGGAQESISGLNTQIEALGERAKTTTGQVHDMVEAERQKVEQDKQAIEAQVASARLAETQLGLGIHSAQYGETQAGFGEALSIARYGRGETFAQMRPEFNRLIAGQRSQATWLDRYASAHPELGPEAVAGLRSQAAQMLGAIPEEQYEFGQEDLQQRIGGAVVGVAQSRTALARAQLFGSPEEIGRAATETVSALTDEMNRLKDAISQTTDVTQKQAYQQELAGVQAEAVQARYTAVTAQPLSSASIAESQAGGAGARAQGLALTSGSAAAVPAYGAEAASRTKQAQDLMEAASKLDPSSQAYADLMAQAQAAMLGSTQAQMAETQYTMPPALAENYAQASGALYRMGRTFAQPGNITDARASVLGDIGQQLQGLEQQRQAVQQQQGGTLTDAQKASFEQQRQDLLNQQADLYSQVDVSYFDRLPALAMGGTSFDMRYLPAPSQSAWMLDRMSQGTLAARNFGSYNEADYMNLMTSGGGYAFTAGKNPATNEPGNLTMDTLYGGRVAANPMGSTTTSLAEAIADLPGAIRQALQGMTAVIKDGRVTFTTPATTNNARSRSDIGQGQIPNAGGNAVGPF